ncbi:MAG: hypothetical protein QOI66_1882 [Myxococcales bacterium]|jgi:electron transfer flavoprotein alpha/beta subunit|nr:hypothetical protein [Myxococcales bacterium]
MRIVVCLRPGLPDADSRRCNVPALVAATSLGTKHEVVALLPDSAGRLDYLLQALAAGAARAVRLVDDQMSTTDFHGLGQLLAAAVRHLDADLVLMGSPFDDEGVGTMSAALAKHLGVLHVARVEAIAAGSRADTVELTVRGGGRKRRLALTAPAVLSVVAAPQMGATEPLLPIGGVMNPDIIETLSLSDPEATVVRRRTEHLGRPELVDRNTVTVSSAAELVAALTGTKTGTKT